MTNRERGHAGHASTGQSGFVLPAVLAMLVVISAAAAAATQHLQTRIAIAADRQNGLRLQGVADGVARMVAASLLMQHVRQQPGLGLPENGTVVACPLPGGGQLQISVQDQAGLVDINAWPRSAMEPAFRALGLSAPDASTIAAEIVDDRDPDDDPEPNGGAEAPQYKARGLPYGPRNAPFDSIDELDRLPSMTDAIAARLRPAVTVHNPGGGLDPGVTPVRALVDTVAGDSLRDRRAPSPHQYYDIRVVAENGAGLRAGRATMLSVNSRTTGTGLLVWRYATATSPAASPHSGCDLAALALR